MVMFRKNQFVKNSLIQQILQIGKIPLCNVSCTSLQTSAESYWNYVSARSKLTLEVYRRLLTQLCVHCESCLAKFPVSQQRFIGANPISIYQILLFGM